MSTKADREANRLRQQAFAERMTDAGFKALRGIWAHRSDERRIKDYIAKLCKQRGDPRGKA